MIDRESEISNNKDIILSRGESRSQSLQSGEFGFNESRVGTEELLDFD